jgi:hypothetical protein
MNQTDTDFSTDYQRVTVKLIDGTILDGRINILPHKRVSDFINSRDKAFVIMIESSSVEVTDKIVFINKSKVAWVEPED